jgi:hypothetical protein
MRRWLGLLLATLAALSLAGCGEAPEEVYAQAKAAAQAKDFGAFTGTLSERSALLLRGLEQAAGETRGRYQYLKDLYGVLPTGDVLASRERGNVTILKVGKSEKDAEDVILLREREGWRIDVLDSPRLWEPLVVRRR